MKKIITLISLITLSVICIGQTQTDSSKIDTIIKKPLPIKMEMSANGMYNNGNVKRVIFNSNLKVLYKTERSEILISPQYTYGTQDDELKEDELRLYTSFETFKHKYIYAFGFSDISSSYKRKIIYQHDIGVGIGKYLINKDSSKISLTIAYMNQHTDFETKDDVFVNRMSLRFKGKHIFKRSKLTYIFWYKPAINIENIYILNSLITYSIPITKYVAFNIKLLYGYDNLVVEGVNPTDTQILFGVKLKI